MSEFNINDDTNPRGIPPVQEQIPHSGVHHDEQPVREFDNTPLHEAVEQGLIQTPDSPAALAPATSKEKAKIPTWKKVTASVVALAGLSAAGYGASKAFGGSSNESTPEPTHSSAPAVPGASETPQWSDSNTPTEAYTPEITSSQVELKIGDYPDTQSLAEAWVKEQAAWINSGSGDQAYYYDTAPVTDVAQMHNSEETSKEAAQAGDRVYVPALFVDNGQSEQGYTSTFIKDLEKGHIGIISTYLNIREGEKGDEPYTITSTVQSVDTLTDTAQEKAARVTWENTSNYHAPIVSGPDSAIFDYTITWKNVNGAWKVSDMVRNG